MGFSFKRFLEDNVVTDFFNPNTKADQERRRREGRSEQYIKGEQVTPVARPPQTQSSNPAVFKMKTRAEQEAERPISDEEIKSWKKEQLEGVRQAYKLGTIDDKQLRAFVDTIVNAGTYESGQHLKAVTDFEGQRKGLDLIGNRIAGSMVQTGLQLPGQIKTVAGTVLDVAGADQAGDYLKRTGLNDLNTANQFVNASRLKQSANEGENALVGDISSGVGSLLTAMLLGKALPMNSGLTAGSLGKVAQGATYRASTAPIAFGFSAGANSTADVLNSGGSSARALTTGLIRGGVEGALETIMPEGARLGGQGAGRLTTALVRGAAKEGFEEASQSLAGTIIEDAAYRDIEGGYNEAIKQALYEGAIGALLGGASSIATEAGGIQYDKQQRANIDNFINQKVTELGASTVEGHLASLNDYYDHIAGRYKGASNKELNSMIRRARKAAKDLGLDIAPGRDIAQSTEDLKRTSDSFDRVQSGEMQQKSGLRNLKDLFKNEDGFISGQNATGYAQAQQAGRVFEGVDGKPRFEVSDENAKVNTNAITELLARGGVKRLNKVLDHPELYKQYPELKNTKVAVYNLPKGTNAQYSPMTDTLIIDIKQAATAGDSTKGSLLHEITHAIQTAEGFSNGSGIADGNLDNYLRNAGEAEARAVEARMNMSDAERYVMPKTSEEYGMSHRPNEDGVPAFDLTAKVDGEQMIPSDMYEQWYGSRGTSADMESIAVLKAIKGNPEADVTIYRASPNPEFNSGDWVTLSKEYAEQHAEGNETKVHSKKVKAKDLRWAMDDVNEFGYYPEAKPQSTFYDSLDVPKDQLIIRDGSGKAMSAGKPLSRNELESTIQKINKETEWMKSATNKEVKSLSENGRLYKVITKPYDIPASSPTKVPVEYVYRAVSDAELANIAKSGYIKSNGAMNVSTENNKGLTVFKDSNPSFYLPKKGGHILKIKVDPKNGMFYDSVDGYVKTPNKIPVSQIEEIDGSKRVVQGSGKAMSIAHKMPDGSTMAGPDTSLKQAMLKTLDMQRSIAEWYRNPSTNFRFLQAKIANTENFVRGVIDKKQSDKAFNTDDKYVYHADSTNSSIDLFKKFGIKPSKTGQSGPGVYMANTEAATEYNYSSKLGEKPTMYRINKQALIDKYGLYNYNTNKDGELQFDETTGEIYIEGNKNIPPEFIEVKKGSKWVPLKPKSSIRQSFADFINDDGGGYDGGRSAKDRINQKESRFKKRAESSEEVSDSLQKKLKKTDVLYNVTTNEAEVKRSKAFIKKNGIRKATTDIKSRLNGSEITPNDVSDAIELFKQLDYRGGESNLQASSEVIEKLSQQLSKAGQNIQLATLLNNRTPEGLRYGAERALLKAGVEVTPEMSKEIKRLTDIVRKQKAGTWEDGYARYKLQEFVAKSVPASKTAKLVQLWKAGLLTSPRTTAGNLAANTAEQVLQGTYVDPVAAGVDKIFSLFTGERSKSFTWRGRATGAIQGTKMGIKYFKTGYDPRNPLRKFDVQEIHYSDTKRGKAAELYTQAVFRLMGAQDQPFYYAAQRNSLYDQAITEAKNNGLKGKERTKFVKKYVTEPSTKALELADAEAKYAVFQDSTALGQLASTMKVSRDGKPNALGEFIIPFSGVPSSIATRMWTRTPLGAAQEIVKQLRSGKFDQRKMSKAIANGSMAVPLMGVGAALVRAGIMTLGYPTDRKERELWEAEGKQPYSIRIGNTWLSTNYFQPAGNLIAAGAEYQAALNEGKSMTEAAAQAAFGAASAFTDQSFLRGVSGTLDAINQPDLYGQRFVEQTIGSIVPNIIRTTARATDPYARRTDSYYDQIRAGIPGLRQQLDKKYDMFGRPVERRSSVGSEMANPLRPSDVKNTDDIVTSEIRRLQDADYGTIPTQIKATTFDQKLNDKQVKDINQKIGEAVHKEWKTIIASEEYQKLTDEEKQKVLERANDAVYEYMKKKYAAENQLGEYAPDYDGEEKKLSARAAAYGKGEEVDFFNDSSSGPKSYEEQYQDAVKKLKEEADNLSDFEKYELEDDIRSLDVKRKYSKDAIKIYGMSKQDAYDFLTNNDNGQKLLDEVIAYGDAMVEAGIWAYNKYRDKNGNIKFYDPSSSSSGGRSKKSRYDYKVFASTGSSPSNIERSLRALVEQAKL